MEHLGTISEGVCWNSLNGMSSEEAHFMETFLDSLSNNKVSNCYGSPTFWPYSHEQSSGNNNDHSDAMYCCSYSSDGYNYDFSSVHSISQGSDPDNGIVLLHSSSSPRNDLLHNLQISEMRYDRMMEDKNNSLNLHILTGNSKMEEFLGQDVISSDDRIELNGNSRKDDHTAARSTYDSSKKRSRSNVNEKNKRSIKSKRGAVKIDDDDDNNATNSVTIQRQNSTNICSEEHSNDSHEANGVSASRTKSIGKTRASRGSATDPQSLYARKRRERINERLRVLQNLVPNGTKVDISTMLEEAVRYVKFLQLQIKLLSSDDLWMYAPIAYNGMEIGLDLKNISSSTTLKDILLTNKIGRQMVFTCE